MLYQETGVEGQKKGTMEGDEWCDKKEAEKQNMTSTSFNERTFETQNR